MPGFSAQGVVKIAPRLTNGRPGAWFDFGDASLFQIAFSEDTVERAEHRTGMRLPNRRLTRTQGGVLTIKGDEFNNKNAALAVKGVTQTVAAAGAPTVDYVLPDTLAVGDVVTLPSKNVTSVSVRDSTGTPKVLTLNTNYTLDAFAAEITIIDLTAGGAYVQPLKSTFTGGAYTSIGAFTASPSQEYYLRITGINTDTNKRGVGEVFRARIPTTKLLAFVNEEYQDWEFDCPLLADLNRLVTDPGGMFCQWVNEQ